MPYCLYRISIIPQESCIIILMFSATKFSLKSSKNAFPYSISSLEIDNKSNKNVLFSDSLYKANEVILAWNLSIKNLKLIDFDFFVLPIDFKNNLEVDMSATKYGSSLGWISFVSSPQIIY